MEGERTMGEDNHRLGKFEIGGLASAKRGQAQVEVTFEVDNNGVLSVTAKDLARNHQESITITNDQNRFVYCYFVFQMSRGDRVSMGLCLH